LLDQRLISMMVVVMVQPGTGCRLGTGAGLEGGVSIMLSSANSDGLVGGGIVDIGMGIGRKVDWKRRQMVELV
jgi:hypothetical protein